MRFKPQRAGSDSWINSGIPPPCDFIAAAVNLAMVPSTQWDGEFVADLAPECRGLRKSEVVGIGGLSAANQTRPLGDGLDMIAVPNTARLRQCQHPFIDAFGPRPIL